MYFSKKVYTVVTVYNGIWGKAPGRSWGIFENFCVKGNLTVCKVTFNCKLQEKIRGAEYTSCYTNNFFWLGTTALFECCYNFQ